MRCDKGSGDGEVRLGCSEDPVVMTTPSVYSKGGREATLIGPQPRAGIKRGPVSAVKRLLARFGDGYPSGEDDRVWLAWISNNDEMGGEVTFSLRGALVLPQCSAYITAKIRLSISITRRSPPNLGL
jgi:hypothetical protein